MEQLLNSSEEHSPISYRQDIDGLRAVAVISVVLFHAFPSLLSGGFIGVDIFFVISGFLITSILIRELNNRTFSIANFYSRRIARIFPALLIIIATCLFFGWLAMLSDEYKLLAKHSIAGAGFVSNLVFWSETSYFDAASETKPLLHLWSLGVEEQFYLAWPILLFFLWRIRANLTVTIGLIIVISFGLNLYQASNNPAADFYSPQTRFWELLTGALLSILVLRSRPSQKLANVMSVTGAALIAYGLARITSGDRFPGTLALLPVCGAALLIASGPSGIFNRTILANRLMVGIGLISYPLYLWHWPLLVFPRIIDSATPPAAARGAAMLIAVILAWATYRFVESPIRSRRIKRASAIKILCGAMVATALTSVVIQAGNGLPFRKGANPAERYTEELGRDPYVTYLSNNFYRCSDEILKSYSFYDNKYGYRCFQSKKSGKIDILLFGDSHAEHLLPGFSEEYRESNVVSFLQTQLPSLESSSMRDALNRVATDKNIKKIFFSALWEDKIQASTKDATGQLVRTFKLFADNNKKIIVLDDVPTFYSDPEGCKYGRRFSVDRVSCSAPQSKQIERKALYRKALDEAIELSPNTSFVPVLQYFCDAGECSMVKDGKLLFRDPSHLTINGSRYLAKKLGADGYL